MSYATGGESGVGKRRNDEILPKKSPFSRDIMVDPGNKDIYSSVMNKEEKLEKPASLQISDDIESTLNNISIDNGAGTESLVDELQSKIDINKQSLLGLVQQRDQLQQNMTRAKQRKPGLLKRTWGWFKGTTEESKIDYLNLKDQYTKLLDKITKLEIENNKLIQQKVDHKLSQSDEKIPDMSDEVVSDEQITKIGVSRSVNIGERPANMKPSYMDESVDIMTSAPDGNPPPIPIKQSSGKVVLQTVKNEMGLGTAGEADKMKWSPPPFDTGIVKDQHQQNIIRDGQSTEQNKLDDLADELVADYEADVDKKHISPIADELVADYEADVDKKHISPIADELVADYNKDVKSKQAQKQNDDKIAA